MRSNDRSFVNNQAEETLPCMEIILGDANIVPHLQKQRARQQQKVQALVVAGIPFGHM